jgi:DnaJ-like protein
VTERKPPGVPFESWVERQIREGIERGEFDDLPGSGKPLPDRGKPYDENWWIRGKLTSENLPAPLPPTLMLRKEAEDALAAAARAGSEARVREIVTDINGKIRDAIRTGLSGPPLNLVPYDVERVVQDWRQRHQQV